MAPNLSHLGRPIPHRRRARKQGMVMTNKTQAETTITIGPRTRHEIELRIRELRARHNASPRDLREVARLEEFLRTVAPRDGRMAMIAVAAGSFALSLFLLCELPACAGSVVTPGDRGSVATPDDREPEHSFDGIYDQRQEDTLLALDCDAHDSDITGAMRDAVTRSCVQRFRESIDVGSWPAWRPPQKIGAVK
jgi:hypothetical protein